jgi:hypothetical protein
MKARPGLWGRKSWPVAKKSGVVWFFVEKVAMRHDSLYNRVCHRAVLAPNPMAGAECPFGLFSASALVQNS